VEDRERAKLEMHLKSAGFITRRRSWPWAATCFAMAVLAACGQKDVPAANGAGGEHPGMAGESGAVGGAPGAVVVGGAGGELEAGGAAGAREVDGGAGDAREPDGESGASGRSFGGAGATMGSIQLNDFGDYQVVQRVLGGSSQRVQIAGAFTGSTIVRVQAQVTSFTTDTTEIIPWTDFLAMDGAYSGTVEVPQGGWYRTVVRGLDEDGNEIARTAGSHRWGVGMNILCIGQSNMVGYGGGSYTVTGELAGLYDNGGTWKHLADPYDRGGNSSDADFDAGSSASLVPSLVNALSDYFPGLPIGVVPAAKGSSPLACTGREPCWGRRNADDPADPSSLYGNSLAEAQRAGGVELIAMQQGETDATNSTPSATYGSELALLAQNYREDLGEVPLFMCQLGRSTTDISVKHRTDTSMQAIRVAQHDSDDPPRIYLAATAIDLEVDGTDHYVKPTLDELGRRMAASIAYHYQDASAPTAYRGPELASASYAGASRTIIDVHLNHRGGNDFTPAADIAGFVVLDDTSPVKLASVVRRNATTIRITLQSGIKGAGSVRYLYGKLPFQTLSNTVHDDSTLRLPLEPTTSDLLLP
jgi:hypothetical protein